MPNGHRPRPCTRSPQPNAARMDSPKRRIKMGWATGAWFDHAPPMQQPSTAMPGEVSRHMAALAHELQGRRRRRPAQSGASPQGSTQLDPAAPHQPRRSCHVLLTNGTKVALGRGQGQHEKSWPAKPTAVGTQHFAQPAGRRSPLLRKPRRSRRRDEGGGARWTHQTQRLQRRSLRPTMGCGDEVNITTRPCPYPRSTLKPGMGTSSPPSPTAPRKKNAKINGQSARSSP